MNLNLQNGGQPLLVVGSVALDTVETPLGCVKDALGGAAVYSSVAASFFTPVRIIGVVGQDFPKEHINFLSERGIDIQGLEIVPGKSFRWSGKYEFDLNQAHTLSTELNVFADFKPKVPNPYLDSKYIFLANIDPDLQLEVLDRIESPKLVGCDTMNYWIENKPESLEKVLKRVNVAFMNDAEARQFCCTSSIIKAGAEIRKLGPTIVVIKKGEHGAVVFSENNFFAAPSYPLDEVCDPTGAGDSFAGGFMGYLAHTDDLNSRNIRKAVVYGSVLASYDVEDFSLDRLKRLTHGEISSRYNEFREIAFIPHPTAVSD